MQARPQKTEQQYFYALSFNLSFAYDDDTLYLAHCYPYTYTDHCEYLQSVCVPETRDRIRRTVLCKSLAGNDVDILIITNF